MASPPTIRDVARLSGVSIGTVDRVVHKRGKVSAKNTQAVQSAIETLGYRPSPIARALVNRRSNLKIGVCVTEVEREFWAEAIRGVNAAKEKLRPFGVDVIMDNVLSYNYDDQAEALGRLLKQGVNALAIIPLQGREQQLDEIIPPEIPYVTVIEDLPQSRRLFHMGPDDLAMGRLSGRLSTLYCGNDLRCVVLAPNFTLNGTQKRIEGFRSFLEQNAPGASILETCPVPLDNERIGYQSIYSITEEVLDRYPELNMLYVTNGLTQWAAAAVRSHKKGGAVSVFGYERTEMTDALLKEGIIRATICQGPAQQWFSAINLLSDYLSGDCTISDPLLWAECRILIEESLPFMGSISVIDM